MDELWYVYMIVLIKPHLKTLQDIRKTVTQESSIVFYLIQQDSSKNYELDVTFCFTICRREVSKVIRAFIISS